VNGLVAVNVVNPFSQNNLLKACVGGFCGGSATLVPGQNPCVATPEQAVQGNAARNEFFIPPPFNPATGRRLREADVDHVDPEVEEPSRDLQTFYDGTATENDLNWEEGFSGDDVTNDLVAVDNDPATAGAIAGGIIGAFAIVGVAAFVIVRRRVSDENAKSTVRDSQMVAGNPMFDVSAPASNAPAYNNNPQHYNNQMQSYYGQNNHGGQQQQPSLWHN